MLTSAVHTEQGSKNNNRLRLEYLDGIRGLAALFVVFHHIYAELDYRYPLELKKLLHYIHFLSWGHFTVCMFIVLSGYCLMLPVIKAGKSTLPGGFRDYILRRSLRILPPYYIAFVISLVLIYLVPAMRYASSPNWNYPLKAFEPGILISHLLLLHNFSPYWINRINIPMWSVATEWQIYFIFPALLIPVWRKFGIHAMIIAGFVAGLAPHFLVPKSINLDPACFWYIGLFAQGMAAAVIGFSTDDKLVKMRERWNWGVISFISFMTLLGLGLAAAHGLPKDLRWLSDPFVGLGSAALLIYCTKYLTEQRPKIPVLLNIFMSKPVTKLGSFSYSLYLIHYPLLALSITGMIMLNIQPKMMFFLSFLVVIPVVVALSYLFYLAFERPCVNYMKKFRR